MPKEVIKEGIGKEAALEVRWGPEHFYTIQLTIDRNASFIFCDDEDYEEFTGLTLNLWNKEQVDTLIKVLQRAKRKTFQVESLTFTGKAVKIDLYHTDKASAHD